MRAICLAALCCVALSCPTWGAEVPLVRRAVTESDLQTLMGMDLPSVHFRAGGFGYMVNEAGEVMPAEEGPGTESALYAELYMGRGDGDGYSVSRLVLDRSSPDLDQFDTLMIDWEGEDDFAADVTCTADPSRTKLLRFGPFAVQAGNATGEGCLVLDYSFGSSEGESGLPVWVFGYLVPTEVPCGEVTVGGESRTFMVVDSNLNGRYVSSADRQAREAESMISVDLDGDGQTSRAYYSIYGSAGPVEVFPPGSAVCVDGQWYRLSVDDRAQVLTVSDPLETGKLVFEGEKLSIRLVDAARGEVTVVDAQGPLLIPAGDYTVSDCSLTVSDGDNVWSLACVEDYGEAYRPAKVRVKPHRITKLDLDMKVAVAVHASATDEGYQLSLETTGPSGLRVVSVTLDGEQPPAPSFRITDSDGHVVETGDFEYG